MFALAFFHCTSQKSGWRFAIRVSFVLSSVQQTNKQQQKQNTVTKRFSFYDYGAISHRASYWQCYTERERESKGERERESDAEKEKRMKWVARVALWLCRKPPTWPRQVWLVHCCCCCYCCLLLAAQQQFDPIRRPHTAQSAANSCANIAWGANGLIRGRLKLSQ